jgi:HK97 family phage prohead protease
MASNSPTYERRTCAYEVRIDESGDSPTKIVGYAAVHGSLSEEMHGWGGAFREEIAQRAFDDVLKGDTRALLNHDPNFIYARTTNGTLRLSADERGLYTEADPLPTQTIRDLVIAPLRRGDINQMSFGFQVDDEHEEQRDGKPIRVIDHIARLFDISVVTFPAYPATDAQARSLLSAMQVDVDSLSTPERAAVRSFISSIARHLPAAPVQADSAPADPSSLTGVSPKVRSRLLELQDRDFALSLIERK